MAIKYPTNGIAASHRIPITRDPDVLVVGAGPSGCAAGLAYAQRGARVLQIETHPEIRQRLAGEWLHPSAVEILRRLGIDTLPGLAAHPTGRGFAVFPHDDQGPIQLSYSNGELGLTCHHPELVTTLRAAATAHPGIQFVTGARILGIDGQRVTLSLDGRAEPISLLAEIVVGADGRSSATRRFLGLEDDRILLSYMAGLLLEDAELPFEGFGHVFLGGPGPIFAYRIGPRQIRACLDVPTSMRRAMQGPNTLRTAYSSALPRELRGSFSRALSERTVAWAANQWHPRTRYGRKGLVLVGDAVGHFHPLTAMGLAMGLGDGWYLAQSKSISDYRRRRSAETYVSELLASTLYQVFTFEDVGTQALKRGLFETWRQSPGERRLAMRLIAGDERSLAQFHHAFLNAVMRAFRRTVRHQVFSMHWGRSASTLCGPGSWFQWLTLLIRPGSSTCPQPTIFCG
jgi:2-polyprenyl-6-methoxyphenol hydroxylase-like FAD-dependent oxidoreductase